MSEVGVGIYSQEKITETKWHQVVPKDVSRDKLLVQARHCDLEVISGDPEEDAVGVFLKADDKPLILRSGFTRSLFARTTKDGDKGHLVYMEDRG